MSRLIDVTIFDPTDVVVATMLHDDRPEGGRIAIYRPVLAGVLRRVDPETTWLAIAGRLA